MPLRLPIPQSGSEDEHPSEGSTTEAESIAELVPDPEPELLDLVERKLVLRIDQRYLSLPVRGELPSLPRAEDFPGGYHPRPHDRKPYKRVAHV